MNRYEIAELALKLMGIFSIIFAIFSLESLMAYVIFTISGPEKSPINLIQLLVYAGVPFSLLLIAGLLLICNSARTER